MNLHTILVANTSSHMDEISTDVIIFRSEPPVMREDFIPARMDVTLWQHQQAMEQILFKLFRESSECLWLSALQLYYNHTNLLCSSISSVYSDQPFVKNWNDSATATLSDSKGDHLSCNNVVWMVKIRTTHSITVICEIVVWVQGY